MTLIWFFCRYTEENVKYICEHLNTIELLNLLELDTEWHHFKTDDYKNFYAKMNQLQVVSQMIEFLPVQYFSITLNLQKKVGMMTNVQNLALNLGKSKEVALDEKGQPKDMEGLFETLTTAIFEDGNIFAGIKQMTKDVIDKMDNQSSIPQSPAFMNIMNKANSDV